MTFTLSLSSVTQHQCWDKHFDMMKIIFIEVKIKQGRVCLPANEMNN